MLLKNFHKFSNKADIPWVHLVWSCHYVNGTLPQSDNKRGSFWWRDTLKLLDQFKVLAAASFKDGSTCFLWLDVWNDHFLAHQFPHLFLFAKNQAPTVQQACQTVALSELFHLPLSEEAFQHFQELELIISDLQVLDVSDQWVYIWGSSLFSSKKAYYSTLLVQHRLTQFSDGYENLAVRTKERSSFGFFYKIV